jgi:two-component system response regulator HydG
VVQEREIQRVGSDRPEKVDVRIIAATNRDLAAEVAAGRFREDLYYRLNVVALAVPPLRDRALDIPLIAAHFLARFADRNRKRVKGFAPRAMDMLAAYPWPGNVRELENSVERAVVLLTGEYVTERELPLSVTQAWERKERAEAAAGSAGTGGGPGQDAAGEAPWSAAASDPSCLSHHAPAPASSPSLSLDEIEKQAVLSTLQAAGGNKSETARRLGITRKTLHAKLARYGAR